MSSGPNSLSEIVSVMAMGPRVGAGGGGSSGAGVDSKAEARTEGFLIVMGTSRARRLEVSGGAASEDWEGVAEGERGGSGFVGFAGP